MPELDKSASMMTAEQIKRLIPQGETTTVQFKIRTEEVCKMGVEMVAFSNAQGGVLVSGINDKTGVVTGLSFEEIQQTNALLANAASENVKPAIIINTETVNIDGQNIMVTTIPKGKDKTYKDELTNAGILSYLVQSTEIEEIVRAMDTNFTTEKLLKNISLMDETGQLERPLEVFVETLTNTFIHRDYFINSPIRLFIFDK